MVRVRGRRGRWRSHGKRSRGKGQCIRCKRSRPKWEGSRNKTQKRPSSSLDGDDTGGSVRIWGRALFPFEPAGRIASLRHRKCCPTRSAGPQQDVLTHEHMRERMHRENARLYRMIAKRWEDLLPAEELPMPAPQFVRVLDVTTGLLFTYFQTPRLLKEKISWRRSRRSLEALVGAAAAGTWRAGGVRRNNRRLLLRLAWPESSPRSSA